jgi:hypothetical protein
MNWVFFVLIGVVVSTCIHDQIQNKTLLINSNLDEGFVLKLKSELSLMSPLKRDSIERDLYSSIRIHFETSSILEDENNFQCLNIGDVWFILSNFRNSKLAFLRMNK